MDLLQAMRARHSVRAYEDKPVPPAVRAALEEEIAACNARFGLKMRLVTEEPNAFGSFLVHYGKFKGVRNYLALVGDDAADVNERAGYCGERVVLLAQALGLNSCWVALTFSKRAVRRALGLNKGEKLVCVIALGYGKTQGVPRRSKPAEKVMRAENPPAWFLAGVEAALLAPTAVNQQKFLFKLVGERGVRAECTGGFYGKVDLGIVRCHFELGAGAENFDWVD